MAVAMRHPDGHIVVETGPLNEKLYRGPVSRIPFLRGLVSLWDTLGLGTKAIMMSADLAAGEDVSLGGPISLVAVVSGLGLGVGLFILLPSFLVGLFSPHLDSALLGSLLEGVVRLFLIVGYIWAVGHIPDMQRVFAYHGAEHKTVNGYEAGAEMTVDVVRRFPKAHTRCGTSFLLTLVVLAVLIFAPFSRLPLVLRILSRILLLPIVAGISYELMRLAARFSDRPWMRAVIVPNLALQRLSTREPDDSMIEVAIRALNTVLADEAGSAPQAAE
jgi:uncharacterized protein YqhQ